jgi:hypothetical protein
MTHRRVIGRARADKGSLMRRSSCAWVAVVVAVGCGDSSPADGTDGASESGSTADPQPGTSSTGEEPSTGEPTTGASSSTSSSSSSGDGGSDSSSSGGEVVGDLELLVSARDAGGYAKFFYYGRSDDGVDGPRQVVPSDESHWTVPEVFDRRVVYFVQREGDEDLVLGSVDSDADQQQLDADPIPAGDLTWPTPVPDAEAIVFASREDDTAYRVDFAGGEVSAPVVVGPHDASAASYRVLVDATARWTALSIDDDVALARIDVPDPDGRVVVNDASASASAEALGFGPDGASLWFAVYEDFLVGLHHVDVRDEVPGAAQSIHPPLGPDERFTDLDLLSGSDGIVYRTENEDTELDTMWFVDVVDGEPSEPEIVLDDIWWIAPVAASADGRWIAFEAEAPALNQRYVVDLRGASEPVAHVLELANISHMEFAPDAQSVWVYHGTPVANTVSRVAIGDDGLGEPETLAVSSDEILVALPGQVTSDGLTMLLQGAADGLPAQVIVDLGGALPGTPVVLSRPTPAGEWAQFGEILPDDEHVLYIERRDIFGPERLLLAELANPGMAEVVMDSMQYWRLIP